MGRWDGRSLSRADEASAALRVPRRDVASEASMVADGMAALTLPGPHVYVGLLGRTADMRSLGDWAWFGNEDVPGYPTLWQQDFVYRP
jgi:hypothetical protein